ncbi:MAG: family 16 glycosylhydrolase [Bacteroidetes bacterium]|nr:family 16 glycosylhydrolase [Bacteroidota bacterium]
MYRAVLLFIFLLMTVTGIRSQVTKPASCDLNIEIPPCPVNPPDKPGFYLLLDQAFQNPAKYWNVSKPYDDIGCVFNFMRNQDNVSFPCMKSTGTGPSGKIQGPPDDNPGNTCYAWLWNTNVPVNDCPYSMGEIKTMTVDTANHTFKSYYFYGTGYVEAKVRQLYCSPGQGSAMWLWCVLDSDDPTIIHPNILDDNEIDVFETRPNDSAGFNFGYHWRKPDGLQKVENYYTVHTHPNSVTGWTVFAVQWNRDSITWYVNNKQVYTMKMTDNPSGCTSGNPAYYFPPDGPFCLRFNSGPNTVGVHDSVLPATLPAHLEIEYVRVYKPEGEKASPITFFSGTPNQISLSENSFDSSNTILSANYYPDATYAWSSPAFEIQPFDLPGHLPQHHSGKVKIWVKPSVQGNQSYPVILSTNLLSHTEQDTAWYFICTSAPPVPTDNFQASLIEGPLCFYEISHPVENSSTSGCEFFNEDTQLWQEAAIRTTGNSRVAFFGRFEPQSFVPIHYREKNACGYSEARQSSLTIPVPPSGTCGW